MHAIYLQGQPQIAPNLPCVQTLQLVLHLRPDLRITAQIPVADMTAQMAEDHGMRLYVWQCAKSKVGISRTVLLHRNGMFWMFLSQDGPFSIKAGDKA